MAKKPNQHAKQLEAARRNVVTLYEHHYSHEQFSGLAVDDRYCLLLLGHIQHEISWLQRLAVISLDTPDGGEDFARSAKVAQTMFIVRILLGKFHEFEDVLNRASVLKRFIEKWYEPENETAGAAALSRIAELSSNNTWIRTARNQSFAHYPSPGQVKGTIEHPDSRWEVDFYFGEHTSNTFYAASDAFANYAWYRLVDPDEPLQGVDRAVGVMADAAALVRDLIERAIGNFIDRNLRDLSDNEIIRARSLHRSRVSLPFFIAEGKLD